MSDVMLMGVLRMPYEMAMGDELSRRQFWARAQQAADEIATLRAENEKLKMANERLVEQNNSLVRKCDPNLSSADLKAVDRHCDWVAFGHAYRAMLNSRAALGEKQ